MLDRFLNNHVLANLTFSLVLVIGFLSYLEMPRAKDPEINFNWVNIMTIFPGASSIDIEKRITSPIEDTIRRSIQDIRFISSTSRSGISNILIRFNQLDERTFDKRLNDLRREVQNTYTDELPDDAEDPFIFEVTTSNAYPSASVAITSAGNDENLRRQTRNIKKDLERVKGVDRINDLGLNDPELHIEFYPERLEGLGITPADLTDTIRTYFRDISAGDVKTDDGQWIVRIEGTNADPGTLANYPVVTAEGIVPLGNLADLSRSTEEPAEIVRFNGQPATLLAITKQSTTNVLELVDDIKSYIKERNVYSDATGVELFLVDDQTISTREALKLMQTNALIGLSMVLLVTWAFLGSRIAILTSIGIPFTLAGTFLILNAAGMTLNNMVLLGVVIALGMLVDDAVVVVESIYQRLQKGMNGLQAATESLNEVFAPVTTSVMTTMAAFLPLMLLPGILGEFMKVIPIVVTLALAISLFEAYWMLPAHVIASKMNLNNPSKQQQKREAATHWIRIKYTRLLLKALRYPVHSIITVLFIFGLAVGTVASGKIRFNFFEADALRLFYVNIEMARGTTLEETDKVLYKIEQEVLKQINPDELRATLIYSGQQFTETEPLFADTVGQIMVSLNPYENGGRSVDEIADEVEANVLNIDGPVNISLLRMKEGPPTSRDINVKIRGDEFSEIKAAADRLVKFLKTDKRFSNITLDYRPGNPELVLRYDGEAIKRAGINPSVISRSISAFVDGEIVNDFQDQGEEVKLRVLAKQNNWYDIEELLRQTISLPDGRSIAIGELVIPEHGYGQHNIRHYNFRRAITLEADIDKGVIDTVAANDLIVEEWKLMQKDYPNVDLDFSGVLDDINESMGAIGILFLFGLGLMYIILGTQFRSYFQPLLILLVTVPLAFTGVVLGLLVTNNPISLYTLYGVVALSGISVNAAIVLISAANSRLQAGMSLLHATVYAARRRVIPIIITSLTTIAGLFSLASGWAGSSLIWGPVATAIVWGLAFSTMLTLFAIPMLYRIFMGTKTDTVKT
ncbi:MAG: efflux RND transporter permease subunit [Proteobacteria bacterium]|nr:efflux RND transporter permease subunit [Pseudomonadota bacterium]NOG61201.1 efflux RND transporter permease subunit [Pseudomonadota bacterium]